MEIVNILKIILEEGAKYAILAIGVYLTYSILDFPDLSVDGTLPLGAIVSAVLILQGADPWLSLLAAFAAGCAAGAVTGLLHVKLGIRPLLCGILMFTALLSVNLVIVKLGTGGAVDRFHFWYDDDLQQSGGCVCAGNDRRYTSEKADYFGCDRRFAEICGGLVSENQIRPAFARDRRQRTILYDAG